MATKPPAPRFRPPSLACALAIEDASESGAAASAGLRDWIFGVRPFVGAIAASSLMLLACSWFAIGSGAFGTSGDVSRHDPIRISTTAATRAGNAHKPEARAGRPDRAVEVHRSSRTHSPSIRNARATTELPRTAAAVEPKPAPSASKQPSRPLQSDSAAPTPEPPAGDPIGTALPAPLDELPVAAPPLPSLPVTPPSLPVPELPTVTVSVETP